jgi:hypothetical protein
MSTNYQDEVNNNIEIPKKRPVGRPKIEKNTKKNNPRNGIVYTGPKTNGHILELIHDDPQDFKRIFNLFKLIGSRDIKMEFKLDSVKIYGTGHLQDNFIDLKINCVNLVRYYCKFNICINIAQENIELISQKIDKSYDSIEFILEEDSYKKSINIVLHDENKFAHEYHILSILPDRSEIDIDNIIRSLNYNDYPLQFTLDSKYFKKIISNISKCDTDFTIEKRSGTFLSFPYNGNSTNISVNHEFTKNNQLDLKSTLTDNDLLSTSVRIEFIQCMASAMLSKSIRIFVDDDDMMVLRSIIDDGTFELIFAVKIVSNKY